jgi:DNA replication and repair protein RecF
LTRLRHISLIQFRCYSGGAFHFPQPITCITGPNGSGKTALLDAVYYLCYTKSYFSGAQLQSVQYGKGGFRIEGVFEREEGVNERISVKWQDGSKEVSADGVAYEKVAEHIGRYAAVMIAPDDLEIINGGSEERRRWMDATLGGTDREYLERLMIYNRVLQQRNAWLKAQSYNYSTDGTELQYYDHQLSLHAQYMHERRKSFMAEFHPILGRFYTILADSREVPAISYESDLYVKPMQEFLSSGLQSDLRAQRTLKGTHRDDLQFTLDGSPLKGFASQGQKKSFLFSLKLAQYAYLSAVLGSMPLLLLDDVFEKLDQKRMEALLSIIQGPGFGQVLLTDTHEQRVRDAFGPEAPLQFINLETGPFL